MTDAGTSTLDVEGHPRRWWALGVLSLTLGMVALDNSILNVALPHVARQLHAGESGLQWVTTGYGLVLAGLLLPFAVLGDRWGRRQLLVTGLVIFGVASVAASQATSVAMLVASRGAMGVGGACAMPATLSLLGNLFPSSERPRAIALWSASAGFAAACGPVVGGLLVDRFWWGSVFLVNGPVAIALVTATFVLVPPSRDPTSPPVDRRSALSWWLSLTFLLVAVIELPRRGLGSPLVFGAALAAGVLFIGFRRNEARTDAPLVDAETAADPRMLAGAATMGALFLGQFGVQFVLTQWLQGPQALAAIRAGSCFAPGALVSMVTPQLNPGLVERFGHRTVASAGLALAALGAALAGLAVAAGSVPGAVVAFAVVGAGVGLASASGSELIMSSAPPARAGSAAGVNETIVEAAGAVGVAVLGSALAGGHWARPLPLAAVATGGAAFLVRRLLRER